MADPTLPLRDRLALDRTVLANVRSFLAYLRTALGFLATGGAFVYFDEAGWMYGTGWALLTLAPVVLIVGLVHFARQRGRLRQMRRAARKQVAASA